MRFVYVLFLAALSCCLPSAPAPSAPAPLPRRRAVAPLSSPSFVGSWRVLCGDRESVMRFGPDGAFSEEERAPLPCGQAPAAREGLWAWDAGSSQLVICSARPGAAGGEPALVRRIVLGRDWRGRDLRTGERVRFVQKAE